MTCSCDYEPPKFCHVQKHKARKEKKCYECCRTIEKGEMYERTYNDEIDSKAKILADAVKGAARIYKETE